jgi:hypothetical protein
MNRPGRGIAPTCLKTNGGIGGGNGGMFSLPCSQLPPTATTISNAPTDDGDADRAGAVERM